MILSNVPYASILATVLRVCVFQRYGFSRLEQFHPMAKYCIALELRSSKFEFILLRPNMKIHALVRGTAAEAWRNTTDRDTFLFFQSRGSSPRSGRRCQQQQDCEGEFRRNVRHDLILLQLRAQSCCRLPIPPTLLN